MFYEICLRKRTRKLMTIKHQKNDNLYRLCNVTSEPPILTIAKLEKGGGRLLLSSWGEKINTYSSGSGFSVQRQDFRD